MNKEKSGQRASRPLRKGNEMKTQLTKFVSIATLAFSAALVAAQQINVRINNQKVQFLGTQPKMVGDRILVPLRGVFEQMGATIDWDPNQRTVSGKRGSHRIAMRAEGHSAMVDNRSVQLDGRAQILAGSLMVPLRFVSEALGSKVDWNATTQTVNIWSVDGQFMSKSVRPFKDHGKKDGGE